MPPGAVEVGERGWPTLSGLKGRLLFRSMVNKLIRRYGTGYPHFITFTCYQRRPLLSSVRARNVWSSRYSCLRRTAFVGIPVLLPICFGAQNGHPVLRFLFAQSGAAGMEILLQSAFGLA